MRDGSGGTPSAIVASAPGPELDPRQVGRRLARFKLEERAFALKYFAGPPDPTSDDYPEYVADLDAFMKKVSSLMTEPPLGGGGEGMDKLDGDGELMAAMVEGALGLDPDDQTLQSKLAAIFRAASEERQRSGLSLKNRDPVDPKPWDDGMKAWREAIYAKLGEVLSADEINRIKSRLGYQFMDSFSMGAGTPMGPKWKKTGDPKKIAAELDEVRGLLAEYAEAEPVDVENVPPADEPAIVIPDLDGLGTELATLFKLSQTIDDTEDPEVIAGVINRMPTIIAAVQVHGGVLEQSEGASALIGDVLGKMVEATPTEAESIDRIVLNFREEAAEAGLMDTRPEDGLAREQWDAHRKELVENYKAEVRAAVAPERAKRMEGLLDDWNPLFDMRQLEQIF